MIIWIIIIVAVILILWLQSSYNNKQSKSNESMKQSDYKYIFNTIKIPVIVVCLLILVYIIYSSIDCKINQDVYISLPNF